MIAIVRDGRTGQFLRVLWDPSTNRVARVLGPALLSDISPGFNDPSDLVSSLPAAQIVGFVGPGAVPGGEADSRIKPPHPPPPIPTYRPLAGAMQNNRGWSREVILELEETQLFESVVAAPRSSGDDAEAIIITLGMTYESEERATFSPSVSERPIRADAILQWGVGGASFSAEVDWQQGTLFVLPASFVNVGLRVFSPVPEDAKVARVTFAASLSYGYSGVQTLGAGARRTVLVEGGLPAGATVRIPVPRWATAFTPIGLHVMTAPPNLSIFVDPGFGSAVAAYHYTSDSNIAQQHETTYPIPNSGRFIEVTNNDLVNPWDTFGILFHLAFA